MDETTAWKEVFYLCLSLGMQTEGKTGIQSVKSFIVENAKAAQQNVQRTADGACGNCGNNCWKLVCETCGAE